MLAKLLLFPLIGALAARQPYDVRKIINAFKNPHNDLTILCAHRGLKWNGTTENSRDAYFRASEAGLECIETDIHLSNDCQLPMIHDSGLGRTTDVGEQTNKPAYNPFTSQGYNPKVSGSNFTGFIEYLHLRDEQGRVRIETVPTLPEMVQAIHDSRLNVVLELDFKDQAAVEPAYWALKDLTNAAGVPANEWCIYKLQATWFKSPEEFEAQAWVQDAFASGIQLALIPVYDPKFDKEMDQLESLKAFAETNYTISAEIEVRSQDGISYELLEAVKSNNYKIKTAGTFFAAGDFFIPPSNLTFFDIGNFSFPEDLRRNNSVYVFQEDSTPVLLDSLVGNFSVDGHDYRTDFNWIVEQGYKWIITDTADEWDARLKKQGRRNISYMIADGEKPVDEELSRGWYRRWMVKDV
ncbi:hypothetical protein PQX77_000677 [Marasmius sp. AFHP31]|nr:hypothetical protein PQX77_011058 [Marasmius sp. AFHP31]KAK1236087.1 hypothetical protein PQX77_000677 [Marasmius sp. AFHP31]